MVSLYTLITGFNVAGPSWVMSPSKPFWMAATGLCYLAVSFQMAGYDGIHCDHPSHLLTDYVGIQLFLFRNRSSSNRTWLVMNSISQAPTFRRFLRQTQQHQVCKGVDRIWKMCIPRRYSTDVFSRVLSIAESSGDTAVSARFSLPSILNFNHFTYFNSTGMSHSFPCKISLSLTRAFN